MRSSFVTSLLLCSAALLYLSLSTSKVVDFFMSSVYIYIYGHPPPLRQTPELYFQSVQEGGGRPTLLNSSSFQKSQNPKIPTQVSDFWKLEREPQNPKTQNSSSFQKSKIPKIPTQVSDFGNSSGSLKSKNPKFLEFPKIQNPKIPTQVSDFWKPEREPQNPKFVLPLEFPKIQTLGWVFWILVFRKLERELDSWILRLPLEFPKIQTLGWGFWNPKFLEFPKIQKFQPKFRIFGNSSGSLKI